MTQKTTEKLLLYCGQVARPSILLIINISKQRKRPDERADKTKPILSDSGGHESPFSDLF